MDYLFDNCVLDTQRRELRRCRGVVPIEPQIFDLLHYLVRNRSVEELGQAQTIAIERDVIERLAKAYGDLANGTSSA